MFKLTREARLVLVVAALLAAFALGLVLGAQVQEGIHQLRAAVGR